MSSDFGLYDVIGIIGMVFYLGTYLALQLGFIRGDGYLYPALNLVASGCVLISLMKFFNPYSAVVEIGWIIISIVGITRLFVIRRFFRLSDDEAAAARALVPSLQKDRARALLRQGRWVEAAPGEMLATEGVAVPGLVFLADGLCRVIHRGVPVATIGAGGVLGEMTYLTGGPATASVRVEQTARYLLLPGDALRGWLKRNGDVASALEHALAGDLRRKLVATTQALSGEPAARE